MPGFACRLAALLACLPAAALADCAFDLHGEVICGAGRCARDRYGEVRCARFEDGGVERTRQGSIVCGKGECVRTTRGAIFCSSQQGGAALTDRFGRARCEGRCEPGRVEWCEQRIADVGE